MKVLCINDANKPDKIPDSEWIKKGETYHVTKVIQMGLQPGKLGYKLKEVSLSQSSFPYEYYDAHRFAIYADQIMSSETEEEKEVIPELEELAV